MSDKTSKWLIGCGIGCGAVILLGVIVVAVGYFLIKDTVVSFRDAEETMDILTARYGPIHEFCPEPDGTIPPERIESFLAVRDSTAWLRQEMERSMQTITSDIEDVRDDERPFWRALKIVRKGVGAIPQIAEYYTARNRALLNQEMGLGEYLYIYIIAYYAYLDKQPEDGPNFRLMDGGEGRYRWSVDDEEEDEETLNRREEDIREERRYQTLRRVRRMFRSILQNQLDALDENPSLDSRRWRRTLEAELEALRTNRDRIPWQDNLPRAMDTSFNPFRQRLEVSYSEWLNPLEVMPVEE